MNEFPPDSKINKIILEILSAQKCVYSEELEKYIIYKHPNASMKLYLEEMESRSIKQNILEGYISEENITEDIASEFFSTEDSDTLEEIESKIKGYELIIKKRIKGSVQYLEDYKKLSDLKITRDSLLGKKSSYKQYTAEYKAREDKYFELLCHCTFDLSGNVMWKSSAELFDSFNGLDELPKIYAILNNFLEFYLGYEPTLIRYIARHPFWRNYYISSDKGIINLFSSRATEDLSLDQLNLMAWSSLYSDINQMPLKDKPSREVIENDELLDQYLDEYNKKASAEAELERQKSKAQYSKALNHSNVVVTPESGNYVSFQKQGLYSDPKEMTGRAEDGATSYDDGKQMAEVKKKVAKISRK